MALAPMADVTDAAFRRIIAKYSKSNEMVDVGRRPFVMYTEFVSADGLVRAPDAGRKKLLADLMYSEAERPIVAQFFSGKPEMMEKAAALAKELGFDGVDINMGCPDRSIEKQGAGAAHMKDPDRAKEVIYAAKQGAAGLPVSIKTRLGYNKDELDTWLPHLLETKPAAITIHARTRKEMSKVPARWERIRRAVEIRNAIQPGGVASRLDGGTLILGNGDLTDLNDARNKIQDSGADGAMLGRAIFGNPFLFAEQKEDLGFMNHDSRIVNLLRVMVEHTKLFEELLPHKNFVVMKKHYKAYLSAKSLAAAGVHGFDGVAELRTLLMAAKSADDVENITQRFIAKMEHSV